MVVSLVGHMVDVGWPPRTVRVEGDDAVLIQLFTLLPTHIAECFGCCLFLTHLPTHIAEGFGGLGGWVWRRLSFCFVFSFWLVVRVLLGSRLVLVVFVAAVVCCPLRAKGTTRYPPPAKRVFERSGSASFSHKGGLHTSVGLRLGEG